MSLVTCIENLFWPSQKILLAYPWVKSPITIWKPANFNLDYKKKNLWGRRLNGRPSISVVICIEMMFYILAVPKILLGYPWVKLQFFHMDLYILARVWFSVKCLAQNVLVRYIGMIFLVLE